MTRRTVTTLARVAATVPEPAPDPAFTADGDQLRRETEKAGKEYAKPCADAQGSDRADAPEDLAVTMILRKPPDEFTFSDIERLEKLDPRQRDQKWEEVKAAARADLASGWLAGRCMHKMGGDAWRRATYLAIRAALREAWPPRHPGEAIMVDQLAQYEALHQHWIGILADWSNSPHAAVLGRDSNSPPRRDLANLAALREAVRMVELCQRLFRSTLATLSRLRRSPHQLFIARAGPVTVSTGPQLHVTNHSDGDIEPASTADQ